MPQDNFFILWQLFFKIMVTIDACIIILSAFIFGRNIAMYALITQYIISKVIDVVIFGFESKNVQIEIITKNNKVEEIVDYIIVAMNRSATTEKAIFKPGFFPTREIATSAIPRIRFGHILPKLLNIHFVWIFAL